MFATIVIILPSMYTGGEVRVVHAGEEKTFDYGSMSQLSTSVLAWYADVVHEVKPITSGFRLALSYNLVQPDRHPIPRPPTDLSATAKLEQIFASWSEAIFDDPPEIVCYKLQHEYSRSNLRRGFTCLKGLDAHIVSRVREVAEKYGVSLGFGQFVLHVTKSEDDFTGSCYKRRRRYDGSDEDNSEDDSEKSYDASGDGKNDDDSESIVDDTRGNSDDDYTKTMSVSGLVNLEGEYLLPKKSDICIDGTEAVFIPKGSFNKVRPDEVEHTDYTGNVSRLLA